MHPLSPLHLRCKVRRKSNFSYTLSFKYAIPSDSLKPYIKQYWAFDNVMEKGMTHTQRIIATGLPELVFYFDNRPKSDKRNLEGNALLNVQQNDFYDLVITDKLSMFSVTFQPQGLSHLLKIPLNELQNQSVYLGFINKAFSQHLEQRLVDTNNFKERVNIVETYFIQLLCQDNTSVDQRRMTSTIELIRTTRGNISIKFLVTNACLGRKQFERKFSSYIGIPPKQYLKIIRFQNAIHLQQFSKENHLTELAYEAGYYDQSHFINETKELTGHTPKRLFETCDMVSDFFR